MIGAAAIVVAMILAALALTTGRVQSLFTGSKNLVGQDEAASTDAVDLTSITAQADNRFGIILSSNTYYQQTLKLVGLRWYQDFSFDTDGIPPGTTKVMKVRTNEQITPEELQTAAKQRPGSYWLIGNEPNSPSQDDLSAESYTKIFHDYVTTLKEADPLAKIVAPEILNFDATCTGCQGYQAGRQWLDDFRLAYKSLYGQEPPVDVWSIHTYDLDWTHLPQGDYLAQEKELMAYRDYLNALPEQQAKPIWLTEFSVVWGYDGMQWRTVDNEPLAFPVGELRRDRLTTYLQSMVTWLQANAAALNIQRWFLFASHAYQEPWAVAPGGIDLVDGTGPAWHLTDFGRLYKELAGVKAEN